MTGTVAVPAQHLPVNEVFGPTWQGEGPHAGRRCGFVRLGGCNLSCEWCDTPFTWDRERYDLELENPAVPWLDLASQVAALPVGLVVLSGGEPLLHARGADGALARLLTAVPVAWHVDTNGTIPPPPWLLPMVEHFTVSPKLLTRDPANKRVTPRALTAFGDLAREGRACFKYVCATPEAVAEVQRQVHQYDLPREAVWIMPEGITADAVLACQQLIAPAVADAGYHLSTRLHVLLWGNEKGR